MTNEIFQLSADQVEILGLKIYLQSMQSRGEISDESAGYGMSLFSEFQSQTHDVHHSTQ